MRKQKGGNGGKDKVNASAELEERKEPAYDDCAVCIEKMDGSKPTATTKCGHTYHTEW
jgi:hypothetical protein